MDMRSGLDGLKTLLGVTSTPDAAAPLAKSAQTAERQYIGSDCATFSAAGHEVAQSNADGEVRADKVAAIQASLAAGTYNVPASAVASKLVDAMLGSGN